MSNWRHHPGVRSGAELSIGEKSADVVRNGMGSWPFVFIFLSTMGIWAAYNGNHGFDPYPFILLNLFLSMIAGLQGAILLISAKRADSNQWSGCTAHPVQHRQAERADRGEHGPDRTGRRSSRADSRAHNRGVDAEATGESDGGHPQFVATRPWLPWDLSYRCGCHRLPSSDADRRVGRP